jgi:hypothetical protein
VRYVVLLAFAIMAVVWLAGSRGEARQRRWLAEHDCRLFEVGIYAKWNCGGVVYWTSTDYAGEAP